jgi:hypothetical protein
MLLRMCPKVLRQSHSLLSTVRTNIVPRDCGIYCHRTMVTITEGVDFDTIAREWRCKWSEDSDKVSLQKAQAALDEVLSALKALDGVKEVQRVVCGGCHDFKVVTSLPIDKFKAWEANSFAPEADFLAKLKDIDGVSVVETQTYTLMPM